MNQTIIQERSGLNQFYAKVYAFVGLGIGLSALVSALMLTVFQAQLVYFLMHGRLWLMIATFAELALVFVASSMAAKNSPAALPVFLVYSVLNGFTLSFVVAFYTPGTVLSAFVSSALLFFVMATIGIFSSHIRIFTYYCNFFILQSKHQKFSTERFDPFIVFVVCHA